MVALTVTMTMTMKTSEVSCYVGSKLHIELHYRGTVLKSIRKSIRCPV